MPHACESLCEMRPFTKGLISHKAFQRDSALIRSGKAVATGVGRALEHAAGLIHKDGSGMTHCVGVVLDRAHRMSATLQFIHDIFGDSPKHIPTH